MSCKHTEVPVVPGTLLPEDGPEAGTTRISAEPRRIRVEVRTRADTSLQAVIEGVDDEWIWVRVGESRVPLKKVRFHGTIGLVLPSGRVVVPAVGPTGPVTEVVVGGRSLFVSPRRIGSVTLTLPDAETGRVAARMAGRVAVDRIIVPNNQQQFSRLNPASFNPHFTIRNLGAENLRSVIITYGTSGFPKEVLHWKGDLKFNQTAEVIIPGEIKAKEGENSYTITLSKPNGGKDGWIVDNELTTTFIAPELYPTRFILQFLTNNKPKDNKIFLIDSKSDTLFSKYPGHLAPNTLYQDTIRLNEGKYELCLTDSAGDGLEFWAEPHNGDGYLRMFDMKGILIHAFESDCGNGEKLSFTASPKFVTDTTQAKYAFSLFPRLISGKTELTVVSNRTSKMTVLITVNGNVYEKHEYNAIKNGSFSYNLSYLPAGRIVAEVLMDGVSRFKGRLNKRRF